MAMYKGMCLTITTDNNYITVAPGAMNAEKEQAENMVTCTRACTTTSLSTLTPSLSTSPDGASPHSPPTYPTSLSPPILPILSLLLCLSPPPHNKPNQTTVAHNPCYVACIT